MGCLCDICLVLYIDFFFACTQNLSRDQPFKIKKQQFSMGLQRFHMSALSEVFLISLGYRHAKFGSALGSVSFESSLVRRVSVLEKGDLWQNNKQYYHE